ncbi:MAG: ABC transporter ATP-binding protein [Planctomycetes bacterium]|nr:ABC transporter ATP-binding protein [Planctomycetota bacterium]
MTTPVLETISLFRLYRQGKQNVAVLKDVTFSVSPESFVAVTGPSGSGKSTLLNLLAGLDAPSSGEVRVEGRNLAEMSEKERTLLRREKIGFVFQFFNLVPTLTVAENIAIPLSLGGVKRPRSLSGGEMQRASIARAVVHEPPIVLADEPTGNLSTRAGRDVLELLRRAVDGLKRTVLLVTHNPRDAAYADQVRFLKDGMLLPDVVQGAERNEARIADRMAVLGI